MNNIAQITQELEARLLETEPEERLTSLDRLMPRASAELDRLNELRFGARPNDGEDVEALALQLAADTVRIVREFRENNPVDPDW